jgi:hypothetical protein
MEIPVRDLLLLNLILVEPLTRPVAADKNAGCGLRSVAMAEEGVQITGPSPPWAELL